MPHPTPALSFCSYLDLYLIHWPCFIDPACTAFPPPFEFRIPYSAKAVLDVWRVMEAMVGAGKTRSIGVSNFSAKRLHELLAAATIPPAVNQVELHPFLQQPYLLEYCKRHNVILTAVRRWLHLANVATAA